jgi:hypothetical protein
LDRQHQEQTANAESEIKADSWLERVKARRGMAAASKVAEGDSVFILSMTQLCFLSVDANA